MPTRTEWGVLVVALLIINWFTFYQPLWVSMLAAFLVGLFSKKLAKGVDKLLGR